MLDKLDGREGKENIVHVDVKEETIGADLNNNMDATSCPDQQLHTLADQPAAAALVADFYQGAPEVLWKHPGQASQWGDLPGQREYGLCGNPGAAGQ